MSSILRWWSIFFSLSKYGFSWTGEIKSPIGQQLWERGLAEKLPSNVLQGHHIFMLDLSEIKTEDRESTQPTIAQKHGMLQSHFFALGLLMGTEGCCLCLLVYKALKRPVPALCLDWPQNPPDLLVATGRCHRLLWERLRPSFQPHSKCHKHRQDTWGNLENRWSLGPSTLLVNTHSGPVWKRDFSSISWKSLFYNWEKMVEVWTMGTAGMEDRMWVCILAVQRRYIMWIPWALVQLHLSPVWLYKNIRHPYKLSGHSSLQRYQPP